MNEQVQPLINLLSGKFGWLPTVLGWISASRIALKFFNVRLQAKLTAMMVAAATGPDADLAHGWEEVLHARWYRTVSFVLDLALSVKLPVLADFLALQHGGTGDGGREPLNLTGGNGGNGEGQKQQPTTTGESMKKLIAVMVLAGTLAAPVMAQVIDTNLPAPPILPPDAWGRLVSFVSAGSNWMVAPYGTVNDDLKKFGGGVAALYKLNDFMATGLRLDYFDGRVFMPSGDFQLQVPIRVLNKLTVIPFVFTGIATPISGRGADNGSPVGIFGAGGAIKLSQHLDLVADYEKWTGFKGNQIRLGILYKF